MARLAAVAGDSRRSPGPGRIDRSFAVTVQASDEATTGAIASPARWHLVDPGPLGRVGQDALIERVRVGGGVMLAAGDPLLAGLPGRHPVASPRAAAGDAGAHGPRRGVARPHRRRHPSALRRPGRRGAPDHRGSSLASLARAGPGGGRVVLELTGGQPLLIEREAGRRPPGGPDHPPVAGRRRSGRQPDGAAGSAATVLVARHRPPVEGAGGTGGPGSARADRARRCRQARSPMRRRSR